MGVGTGYLNVGHVVQFYGHDDTALVVTELAANAIIHARSSFAVDLSLRPDALASRWGVQPPGPAGKAVWVERRRQPGGP